jgi:hypothetical protein
VPGGVVEFNNKRVSMKQLLTLTGFKWCFVMILFIPLNAFSQTDSTSVVTEIEPQDSLSKGSPNSLFAGAGVGNSLAYLGSTISGNQQFGYTTLSYGFNNELFASVSAVHLNRLNPFMAFYNGSLNYSHVFNTWFDIAAGVSAYKFTHSKADTLLNDFMYTEITLGVDFRLIYSRLSFGYLASDESNVFIMFRNSRYFQTSKFIKDKAFISFDPYVNMLAGTMFKTENSTVTTGTSTISNTRFGYLIQSVSSESYTRKFGIREIEFGLPVALNFKRLTVEIEAGYVLPTYNDPAIAVSKGMVFLVSGSFRIF